MYHHRGPGLGFNPQPDPPKGARVAYQSRSATRMGGGGSISVPLYSNPGQSLSPYGAAPRFPEPAGGWALWGAISTVSMAASAYHGYKRNQSVGWALVWGALGAMFPILVPTIAVAQGFGKKA